MSPEGLAEFVPAGTRFKVLPRPATMRPIGEVWRLGLLLLGTEFGVGPEAAAGKAPQHGNAAGAEQLPTTRLWGVGRATRAAERGRPGYQSASREERREIAAAALRGGYAIGTPVNFEARPLPLDAEGLLALGPTDTTCPIGFSGDEVRVRWRPGAPLEGAQTLADYLTERVDLIIHRGSA